MNLPSLAAYVDQAEMPLVLELPCQTVRPEQFPVNCEMLIYIKGCVVVRTTTRPIENEWGTHKCWYLVNLNTGMTINLTETDGDSPLHFHYKPTVITAGSAAEVALGIGTKVPGRVTSQEVNTLLQTLVEGRVSGDDIYKSERSNGIDLNHIIPGATTTKLVHRYQGGWQLLVDGEQQDIATLIEALHIATTTQS